MASPVLPIPSHGNHSSAPSLYLKKDLNASPECPCVVWYVLSKEQQNCKILLSFL